MTSLSLCHISPPFNSINPLHTLHTRHTLHIHNPLHPHKLLPLQPALAPALPLALRLPAPDLVLVLPVLLLPRSHQLNCFMSFTRKNASIRVCRSGTKSLN